MGGYGSGRSKYATTPTVEECRTLAVNALTDIVDYPGAEVIIRWGSEDNSGASINVSLEAPHDADRAQHIRLEYTVLDRRSGEERPQDYHVPLEYTECNFGGVRPWFRCPGIIENEHCDRRVGKLYQPPLEDLFLCRHCYALGYRSSRTSGDELEQTELRYRRAYARIDENNQCPHPNEHGMIPPRRPKGMHRDTYDELVVDLEAAYRAWEDAMNNRFRDLVADMGEVTRA